MTRRMLINAQRREELRIAIITDDILDEYQVAVAESGLVRGNIYRAVVASVQPSLDAAFVDYGGDKHALLPRHDLVPQAYHKTPPEGTRYARIDKLLEKGKPLLVQVVKDPSGTKGAAVTTNLSLAGRYVVLMPYDDVRGISRKVEDETARREFRDLAAKLDIPEGFGFIVRTAAIGQTKAALNRDLAALLRLWRRIQSESKLGKGPRLLYSDQDLIVQAVRDLLEASIDEVLVDDPVAYDAVRGAMRAFMPRSRTRVIHYQERLPLFSRFKLESQIEAIFQRRLGLPSGGSIVIESTEALTAIDVNSGKAMRGANQEETAHATNLEAAREVARQLRLRDIGGLIVVDFIDMRSRRHDLAVEKALKDALKADRARVTVGRISPNGLLEINRQRLKTPLVQRTHRPCPTCGGLGRIASPETVSLSLLRRIEERAAMGGIKGVCIRLHPELADAFQNHHRQELAALEREFDLRIEIIAATNLHRSEEEVTWVERSAQEASAPAAVAAVRVGDLTRGKGQLGEASDAEEEDEDAEQEGETGAEKKSRRRKRGGRRRRKASGEGAGAEVEGPG
ncbi:MAG: Rne/Rng family ribonuclease, partial [Acidobacteriota bacterium]